jgi:hypothetical protein
MMKVAWQHAEYNATLPPYRFSPGDVVEIEDDWAKQLIQRGIAIKAKDSAKTVLEQRQALRPVTANDGGAQERAERRAALQAELEAIDRVDAAPRPTADMHFGDMVTRGDVTGQPDEDEPKKPASAPVRPAERKS